MKRSDVVAIIFFLLITIIFFYKTIVYGHVPIPGDLLVAEYSPWKTYSYAGYNPGSFPNKAQYFDVLRQLYPWKTFSINALKDHVLPLWNPYNFSGTPLLANFQSAVFYPFNVLYLLFSQMIAWSILVMLQPFLAGIFTYLYCRKIGITDIGAFLSGISFSFSSFMIVWLEYNTIGHVILWLPLILLSVEQLLVKKTYLWMGIFIFSLISSLFAGHPQIFMYLIFFVVCYMLYRTTSVKKSRMLFLVLLLLSLGIGAIQLLPGIELLIESARSSHTYDDFINKILIAPWQLIMLLVPDFFGNPATRNYWISDTYIGKVIGIGLIPLFFTLLTFWKRKNPFIHFFIITAAVVFLFATLNPVTLLLYKMEIPFISSSAPTLAIFLFCFSLSVLSGFGTDIWMNQRITFRKFLIWISPILLIFFGLWIGVFLLPKFSSFVWAENLLTISLRPLLYETGILVLVVTVFLFGNIKTKIKFFLLILLVILQTMYLFRAFHKFNPFSPQELIFPKAEVFAFLKKEAGINRFWGYGSGAIEANFATEAQLFSPDGYDPLYPKWYGEFIQSSKNGKIETVFTDQTRSDAVITHGSGEEDLSSNQYRFKILDLLGVQYVIDRVENNSTEKTFPKERFTLVYEKDGWKVFENLKALPRAFLVSDYKVFKSSKEFETIFFNSDFDSSQTILLEKNPDEIDYKNSDPNKINQVHIQSYMPNKIVLRTETSSNKLLFLSDTYYPGWKAFVDNNQVPIYRANYAFRAIALSSGQHTIVFTYNPISFKIGLGIMGLSISAIFIACLFIIKKKVVYE